MGKSVDSREFWKDRIENAPRKLEHYSVYAIHTRGWKKIGEEHRKIIENEIGKKQSVLDAGCGYGRVSEWIDEYLGVDFSPEFIQLARTKYPNKSFEVQDLKSLPYPDKSFDWAICLSVKQMIQANLGNAVWDIMEKELKRVAKKILILEYGDPEKYVVL